MLLDFNDDCILENDRVRLSCLNANHIPALSKAGVCDRVWTFFTDKEKGKMEAYCQEAIQNRQSKSEYPFVIYDKRANRLAGMTRMYEFNSTLKNMKIGHTWIGEQFWRTGLNVNCNYLLFEYAFENLGANRIGFGVHGENHRSMRAIEKVGCSKEGVLRSYLMSNSKKNRADLILYSILKAEWNNEVKSDLLHQLYQLKLLN